jgi:hypothetical protein
LDAPITYQALLGGWEWTNEVRHRRVTGFLDFNGSSTVKLPYPPLMGIVTELDLVNLNDDPHMALKKFGTFLTIRGGLFVPNKPEVGAPAFSVGRGLTQMPALTIDMRTWEIVAAYPCYGTVQYDYTTSYQIMRYWPETYADWNNLGKMIWNDQGYGKLLALQSFPTGENFITTIQVKPVVAPMQTMELYRIEYSVLVNGDGTWEIPMRFPLNYNFPMGTDPIVTYDIGQAYMQVSRVLEIAYFGLIDPQVTASSEAVSFGLTDQQENVGGIATPIPGTLLPSSKSPGDISNTTSVIPLDLNLASANRKKTQRIQDYLQGNRSNVSQPKIRVDTLAFKLSKPYDIHGLKTNDWKQFVWVKKAVDGASSIPGADIAPYIESTKTFRIQAKVTVGKIPLDVPDPSQQDKTNLTAEQQYIKQMNNTIYRAWRVIDWQRVMDDIQKRYPSTVFVVDVSEILALIKVQ